MRRLMKAAGGAAMLLSSAATSAQGTPACLTDQEARALFAYAIPEALTGVAKTCRASLPSSSFLATRSAATIAEFRAAAAGSWPTAKAAFLKIAGADEEAEVIARMSDAALQPFVAEAFAGVVAKDVNVADCPKIDRFVAALAPLPPASVTELIASLVGLVGEKESGNLKLC